MEETMKLSRIAALALSLALGTVALGTATPAEARPPKCPSFHCPIDIEGNCLCEWILCPDGNYYCGENYN
jgi:hypothetical protein